jgi:integrase
MMALTATPLTDAKVKTAKPRERAYKLFDGGGLFLYVAPSGTKTWRLKYRDPRTRKERQATLGKYPALSLKEARKRRDEFKEALESGDVPGRSAARTFEEVALEYIDRARIGESHKKRQIGRLRRYLFGQLGALDIKDVRRGDVIACIDAISDEKAETKRRVFTLAAAVFRYAATREYVEHSILSDIDRSFLPKKRENHYPTLTKKEDVAALLRAIDAYPDEITKRALLFAILTAQRPGNIRLAKWSQIVGDVWMIPAEEMKMKRPHAVPLSQAALDVLDEVRTFSGASEYIFPSPLYLDRPMSDNTMNMALKRLGYKNKIVAHGFRAMFSTIAHEHLSEHGCSPLAIEAVLAHKEVNEVKAAYNHATYEREKRVLLAWWAGWLNR